MAKYYGKVGYTETSETSPGIWTEDIVEYPYYGDYVRNFTSNNHQSSVTVNNDITLSNSISILADQYANKNFQYIRYIEINGVKWTVSSVEVVLLD